MKRTSKQNEFFRWIVITILISIIIITAFNNACKFTIKTSGKNNELSSLMKFYLWLTDENELRIRNFIIEKQKEEEKNNSYE